MKKLISIFWGLCLLSITMGCGPQRGDFIGINKLEAKELEEIDLVVDTFRSHYVYIDIALVRDEQIVLTKTYGQARLNRSDVYASVSKPVTAMITLQLLEQGKIKSLDDPIGNYAPKYVGALPDAYTDTPITFKHLLSHQSGIPHLSDMWEAGKLKLAFRPGDGVLYSTLGYGVLGDVLEEIAGQSYPQMVKTFIGEPIGANSFDASWFFSAPGGLVKSTIEDMARFAIGVMKGTYVSRELLDELAFQRYASDRFGGICLGWYCNNLGGTDLMVFHAGSNGRPRAYLRVKPHKGLAVAILGMDMYENGVQDFGDLSMNLMGILDE